MIHSLLFATQAGAAAVPRLTCILVPWSDAQALYAARNCLASTGVFPLYVAGRCTYDLGPEHRSWNVNWRRVLYEPVNIIGEGGKVVGEGDKSLHDLCGVHLAMLMKVMRRQSLLWRCRKVSLYRRRSVGLVDVSNVDLIA